MSQQARTLRNQLDRIMSRFDRQNAGTCAALAAAGVGGGMLAMPQQADASIIHFTVNLNIPSTTAGLYLNFVTGVNNTNPALVPGWDVNPFSSTTLSYFNPTAPAGGVYVLRTGGGAPGNLPVGTGISATPDGGRLYGSGAALTTGSDPHVLSSSNNCIGVRFQNEANQNLTHYGWMRISLDSTLQGQPREIVEYAYENVAGAAIPACVVPEPASLGMLALGAAGLFIRRRRSK